MFDFPASPSEGQAYSPPGGPGYVYTGGRWKGGSAPATPINEIAEDAFWATRADFVTDVAGGFPIYAGKVYTAGGYDYIGTAGATALPGLPGLLAHGSLTPEHFGIPQGSDQTALLQSFIDYAATAKLYVKWPDGGDYRFQKLLVSGSKEVIWDCDGWCKLTSLLTTPDPVDDYAVQLRGSGQTFYPLIEDAQIGQAFIKIADPSVFAPGDICEVRSTRLIQGEHRGQNREGQSCLVRDIDIPAGRVNFEDCLHYFAPANDVLTGAVQAVASTTQMTLAASIDRPQRDMMRRVTMTSGAQNGQSRYITAWDNTTKVAKFEGAQSPWGAGILPSDTYAADWSSSAAKSTPIKVKISKGLHLTRAPHINAVNGADGFLGLRVLLASTCDIRGLTVDYFSHCNIAVTACYRPIVKRNNVSWANRIFDNGSDGTGYGIAVGQCYQPDIEANYGRGNRRLVDFGGSQAITWYGKSTRNKAEGGGKSYTGAPMFPENPDCMMQVSGSHGSAYGTVYDGDTGVHVYGIHNLRGLNEYVKSAFAFGYHRQPILLHSGGGHTVEGVHHKDMFSEIGKDATNRYAVASRPAIRPGAIVSIWVDTLADQVKSLPTRVFNCTADKAISCAISLTRGTIADAMMNLEFGNIRVNVSDEGITPQQFNFLRTDTARNVDRIVDLGGNTYSFDGVEYTDFSMLQYNTAFLAIPDNSFAKLSRRKYFARILVGGVIAIPVSEASSMIKVSIWDKDRDRAYRAIDVLMAYDRNVDYSPLAATNKTGVELSNQILTGSVGTSGKVTLAWRPAGAGWVLYVENRTTAVAQPYIEIDGLE